MKSIKKPSKNEFEKILNNIEELPDKNFGSFDFEISSLPCIQKKDKKIKYTATMDKDIMVALKEKSKEYGVTYSALLNDILRKVLL